MADFAAFPKLCLTKISVLTETIESHIRKPTFTKIALGCSKRRTAHGMANTSMFTPEPCLKAQRVWHLGRILGVEVVRALGFWTSGLFQRLNTSVQGSPR